MEISIHRAAHVLHHVSADIIACYAVNEENEPEPGGDCKGGRTSW